MGSFAATKTDGKIGPSWGLTRRRGPPPDGGGGIDGSGRGGEKEGNTLSPGTGHHGRERDARVLLGRSLLRCGGGLGFAHVGF